MELWLDAQLSPSLLAWLGENYGVEGHAVQADSDLIAAQDEAIFAAARAEGAVVMTKHRHMKKVYWTAYATGDHYAATQLILDRVSAWGVPTQVNRYSDLMVSAVVEVEDDRLEKLRLALEEVVEVDRTSEAVEGSSGPCLLFLNVRMREGTGDLSIETPDVPG